MININDKDGLFDAMKAMNPGDQIEVQGNGGSMTIGVPSGKGCYEEEDEELPSLPDFWTRNESWFD